MDHRIAAIAALIAMATPAGAQTIVDGSGADLPPEQLEALHKGVTTGLRDPLSAQLRGIKVVGSSICGEINAKNGFGAYVGFQPFGYDPATKAGAVFDPAATPRDAASEEAVRRWGCYDDGLPESEWGNLTERAVSCLQDFELLAASQGVEPPAGGRDFNELFATVRACAEDRFIPARIAAQFGLVD